MVLVLHLAHWIPGSLTFPSLSLPVAFTGAFTPLSLAVAHYANQVASRSLAEFRPALELTEGEVDHFHCRLTRTPRGAPIIGLVIGAIYFWRALQIDPTFLNLFTGHRVSDLALGAFGWLNTSMLFVNLYYLAKQLSTVGAVHKAATNINLFDWQPMFAFSNLTYRTSVLAVVFISAVVVVFLHSLTLNPIRLVFALSGYLLTGALFFLPLSGLHTKLETEKHRLLSEARRRIQAAMGDLDREIDAGGASSLQPMRDRLGALLQEEEYLSKLRTWPWPPGMFWKLVGVIGLPMFIFVLQRALLVLAGL